MAEQKKPITLVNLTPHDVHYRLLGDTETRVLKPEKYNNAVRVKNVQTQVGEVNGMPLVFDSYRDITGLPEPKENTLYVVSLLVQLVNSEKKSPRLDLIGPDMSEEGCERDDKGRVMWVKRWATRPTFDAKQG
jgi:hypothetical protein